MADLPPDAVHLETVAEWRGGVVGRHQGPGVWLVSWKSSTGRPAVPYVAAVEEALAFGWIDATARTLDAERSMQWFTRRKPGSGWARTNKERILRLEADGRMTDAGRAVIDAAKADGSWALLDDVENLVVPPDLAAALAKHRGAAARGEESPPSARRMLLAWIVQAKRPATRAQRVAE